MKENKHIFIKSIIFLMISQTIIKIVGLVTKLYLTNKSGYGDMGNAIFSSGFQIYALFLTVSSISVPTTISQLISAKVAIGDNKGAYRIFKIAVAIFGTIGFIGSMVLYVFSNKIASNYLQIPEAEQILQVLAPSIFIASISSVLRGYFNGREKISVTAKSQSFEQILKAVATIILVEIICILPSKTTETMAAAVAMALTISIACNFLYLYISYIKTKKQIWQETILSTIQKKEGINTIIKKILMLSIPISVATLLSAMNKTIDALTLIRIAKRFMTESDATLQYGILSGKIDTLITIPFSFNIAFATTLVPTIASAIAKKQKSLAESKIKFSMLVGMLIALPCMFYLFVFAEPVLKMLFPNAASGTKMLQISSISIIFVVLTQTINGSLQGYGKVNFSVIILGIGAIAKLVFNIILINLIGVNGAIISTIISHIIVFICSFMYLKRIANISFELKRFFIKPIVATITMTISIYLLYKTFNLSSNLNLIISTGIGIAIYIIMILILKTFTFEEITAIPFMKKVIKNNNKKYS